jgi:hypothetical protein
MLIRATRRTAAKTKTTRRTAAKIKTKLSITFSNVADCKR